MSTDVKAGKLKLVTLKKNREFSHVYSRGKACSTKYLVMLLLPRKFGGVRAGFTVSKKVGCSVRRNKLRRRLKECIREYLPRTQGSAWIVIIGRVGAAEREYSSINKDIRYLLKRHGLLKDE